MFDCGTRRSDIEEGKHTLWRGDRISETHTTCRSGDGSPAVGAEMSKIDRRDFLASVAATVAASATPLDRLEAAEPNAKDTDMQPPKAGLAPRAFTPLPLGDIKPKGWLARQLRIQADGLSGHLDEFWPDIAQSGWFGGNAEKWERAQDQVPTTAGNGRM